MKLRDIIDPSQEAAAEAALAQAALEAEKDSDPILLKILTGISAWVASLFLIGFIGVALQPDEGAILFIGGLLTGFAICLHHMAKNAGVFMEQSTLSCMMCGHLLILIGVIALFDFRKELLILAITQSLLCALPIWVFRKGAYQASSLLAAVFLWTYYSIDIESPWLFRLLLSIEVLALGYQTLRQAHRNSFTYALALAVGGTLFFLDWIQSNSWRGSFEEALWPTNLIMAIFVAATGWHFTPPGNRRQPKILILFLLLIIMAFLSSPGLLFAIALLMLGFGLRDKIFGALGLLSLPGFLVYFYYSLQVSLIEKSGILLASGLLCLFVAYLAHRSNKEVQA